MIMSLLMHGDGATRWSHLGFFEFFDPRHTQRSLSGVQRAKKPRWDPRVAPYHCVGGVSGRYRKSTIDRTEDPAMVINR
jgi:hypothetical protein